MVPSRSADSAEIMIFSCLDNVASACACVYRQKQSVGISELRVGLRCNGKQCLKILVLSPTRV